jgi:glycosyltransferase involved in cell wall biosynthesis
VEERITIVIPTYNGGRFLARTVVSLLRQTHQRFRLVVVDDGSVDDSLERLATHRDARLEIVRAHPHLPMVGNWNRAIDQVDTRLFLLAHADDLYEPSYLERMVPLLDAHPRAFIAHCRALSIDQDDRVVWAPQERYKDRFWPAHEPCEDDVAVEFGRLRRGNYILMPSALYRSALVREIGPFDGSYQFVPDWQYWFRGLLGGYTIVGTHDRLLRYRRHPGSMTKRLEQDMTRFREERELLEWATRAGHAAALLPHDRVDYRLVENSLLSEFAHRLDAGDRVGARRLLDHGRDDVPGFAGSWRDRGMSLVLRTGTPGGRALRWLERLYLDAGARLGGIKP